jgi:hypothetical protein
MTVHNKRQGVVVVLLLMAVLAAAAVVLVRGLRTTHNTPTSPVTGKVPPRLSADRFLDSVGVNVHVTYLDTSYGRMDQWAARLKELGVRHVRDGLSLDNATGTERLRALADAGMRLTLITSLDKSPDDQARFAAQFGGAVDAIEAPNEADVMGPSDWAAKLQSFLPRLRKAVDEDGPPSHTIIGPSFVSLESWKQVGGTVGTWDVTNLHSYPGGEEPSSNLDQQLAVARQQGRDHPVEVTETGYQDAVRASTGQPPVSEKTAAAYLPRMALGYFAAGIKRMFVYELADEKPDPGLVQPEQHFGLLREDLTPKPAFNALRNLLRTVRTSDGPGERRVVHVDAPSDVRSLVLERDDGSSVLALWRSASAWNTGDRKPTSVSPVTATVQFDGPATDIKVSRPSVGAEPVQQQDEASTQRVEVSSDAVLISYR